MTHAPTSHHTTTQHTTEDIDVIYMPPSVADYAQFMVIASVKSSRHLRAIAQDFVALVSEGLKGCRDKKK